MRMASLSVTEAGELLETALGLGINFFDHADIYGQGRSEEVFGQAMRERRVSRDQVVIQTKCGIRSGFYDFSKEHIVRSVEGSLRRLGTDYVDVLLLHRPDTLVEPEEVAEAFEELETSGKVRYFGVSNQNPLQIELLRKSCSQKLLFNQLQFSLVHTGMVDSGFNVNLDNRAAHDRDGSILEYSRLREMTIQAWSPLQYGFIEGVFLDHPQFATLNQTLAATADRKGVTPAALAIAWILRHPAKMQPIVGTTSCHRLKDLSKAGDVGLSRQEWYELYLAAGNTLP
ncbi:MAG TPA: aldo/keto reductase family oxidoreductase [Firmicutes bacterium]|jgi:predicted oxidoreductase|nr:aldo/keto reductase family oxidoreductase [Bacillota bacterium]